MRALAVLPFLGILLGAVVLRGATQLILGVPALLAWLLAWIVLTSAIVGIVYVCDPANRRPLDRRGQQK
jgi:hypothetical protein